PVAQQQLAPDLAARRFLSSAPTEFTAAAAAATPAVVFIRSYEEHSGLFSRRQQGTASTGSGVIIGSDGYIVTNNHVIEGGTRIEVTLANKQRYEAKVVGTDPSTDLALLKLDATDLPTIPLGNSDSLLVGEWVLAVGNPFNLESTVTAGIVSAKGRNIDILEGQDRIESFIQTDAVVNPGNSGGALVNTNGELIGINTAIITRSGGYEGYSFAVPVNLVRKIIRDLQEYGSVQRGLLGVFIQEVDAATAAELGLEEVAGVIITRITEDSGADNAGLKPGDVITGINGKRTHTAPSLQEILGQLRPGNKVQVEFIRDGRSRTTEIVLKNKLNSTSPLSAREERLLHDLGFELRNLSRAECQRLRLKGGTKVISVFRGSRIGQTNMEPGFIITALDNRPVNNTEELLRRLRKARGEVILSGVYEHYEGEYFYAFQMP
ncbi:MAG: Do family serine endopeptidase, partial [Bacteroidetes bacterium]